jgi:hypothetical protein
MENWSGSVHPRGDWFYAWFLMDQTLTHEIRSFVPETDRVYCMWTGGSLPNEVGREPARLYATHCVCWTPNQTLTHILWVVLI